MTAPRESALIPSLREEWNGPEWGSQSAYSLSLNPPVPPSMGGQKATPSPVYSPCNTKYGRFFVLKPRLHLFPAAHQKGPDVPLESLPTVCCGSETGYIVTCWQPGRHLGLKSNGINLLLSVRCWSAGSWAVKGGGHLTLPEQTCNVQGRVQTMDFCSHLNSFA